MYQDFLSTVSHAIYMRTDQPPFNDVRVRRAISHAINRQEIIDAVWIKGEPIPAVSRGLAEWSPRIDELGAGARYYQYDPKEARRLLAEAGVLKGFKTLLHTTNGTGAGPALVDAAQLAQRSLKEVGIETELKIEEYGAYMATTYLGKFEGLVLAPISNA
jgi:peptide/nickel transport system substrate-binding protein